MILMHVHIPRTAGANLGVLLRGHLKNFTHLHFPFERFDAGVNNPGPLWLENQLARHVKNVAKAVTPDKLRDLDNIYIQGHMPFGIHRYTDKEVKYITILRNPQARVWSRYRAYWSATNYAIYKRWKEKYDLNLERILRGNEIEMYNDQTRLIIGTDRVELTEDDADEAIELLKNEYAFVSTTENFQSIGKDFEDALGIRLPISGLKSISNTVSGSFSRNITQAESALIAEKNQLDARVWAFVKSQVTLGDHKRKSDGKENI